MTVLTSVADPGRDAAASPPLPEARDMALQVLPSRWDPLNYVAARRHIDRSARRRFNRLYACCFHEQIAFLEASLSESLLTPLLADPEFAPLWSELALFQAQEQRHAAAFHAWNRHFEPGLYAGMPTTGPEAFRFVRMSRLQRRTWTLLASRIRQAPFLLWFVLLQEERAVNLARELLRGSEPLDPGMRRLHAWHLQDEGEHLRCDEALLAHLWTPTAPWRRQVNARLLLYLVREYYTAPKRGGQAVLTAWLQEYPEYAHLGPSLARDLAGLGRNPEYLAAQYGRSMIAQTLTAMAGWPEFDGFRRWVAGFTE